MARSQLWSGAPPFLQCKFESMEIGRLAFESAVLFMLIKHIRI